MKHLSRTFLLITALLATELITSCGDEEVTEVIVRDTVYITDTTYVDDDIIEEPNPEADALLAAAYARWRDNMYNHQNQVFGPNVWSGDLMLLPSRNGEWFDNGRHIEFHTHSYTSANTTVDEAWDDYFESLGAALIALDAYETAGNPIQDNIGQAKAVVAFNLYNMFDMFGKVLYDRENTGTDVVILEGTAAMDEIELLLREALGHMDDFNSVPSNSLQFTEAAVWTMLAKLYLNKGVFADRYATPTFDAADMDTVYKYTSKVIDFGTYELEADYFRMFDVENTFNSEFILAVEQISSDNRDFGRSDIILNQHGRNQRYDTDVRGSNGGCITTTFFNMWDQTDPRFFEAIMLDADGNPFTEAGIVGSGVEFNRGILHGQQYGPVLTEDGSAFETDGDGNVLIEALVMDLNNDVMMDFTPEIEALELTETQINQGARTSKYQVDPIGGRKTAGNEIPLIRLADVYLLRAEAVLRGASDGDAVSDVNAVRTARGGNTASGTSTLPALGSIDLDGLLDERAFELYWEGHRRSDLIRYNKYEDAWTLKAGGEGTHLRVMPIPDEVLSVFSAIGLTQNTGY